MSLIDEIKNATKKAQQKTLAAQRMAEEAARIKEVEIERASKIKAEAFFKDVLLTNIRESADKGEFKAQAEIEDYRVGKIVVEITQKEGFAAALVNNNREYISFDDVIVKYGITGDKLKRLVSEGEIRAFREGNEMKFNSSEVCRVLTADQTEHPEHKCWIIDVSWIK